MYPEARVEVQNDRERKEKDSPTTYNIQTLNKLHKNTAHNKIKSTLIKPKMDIYLQLMVQTLRGCKNMISQKRAFILNIVICIATFVMLAAPYPMFLPCAECRQFVLRSIFYARCSMCGLKHTKRNRRLAISLKTDQIA